MTQRLYLTAARNLYGLEGVHYLDEPKGLLLKDGEFVAPTPQEHSEIIVEVARLQAAYDALDYSRLRKAKYDLLNQDEMRYDDLVNNTTTWRDGIAAIKTAHPKP